MIKERKRVLFFSFMYINYLTDLINVLDGVIYKTKITNNQCFTLQKSKKYLTNCHLSLKC